jgi:hypothetical protein
MVTHVVMWRLEEPTPERVERFTSLLRSLEGEVPGLLRIEVGVNWLEDPNAFDVVLITRFATRADVDAYRLHPFHVAVAAELKTMAAARSVVDFDG